MTDLTGRAALVTGASRGIGHAIAAELLTRGASVTITARKPDELAAAAKELVDGPAGGAADRVLAVSGNAGSAESREETVTRTVEAFGRLDILVNNTGINPTYGPLMDADLDAVRKIFDVNVVAALGFVQLAYRAWMGEHGGAVVNISSVAGLRSTGVIADDPDDRGAGLGAGPRDPGQRRGARHREDAVRHRAGGRGRGQGQRRVPDEAPRCARGCGPARRLPGVRRGIVDHR
jgi:NAD(P)-dependent dehydrogenase (short-subunit alcohol dehydrogenase family)